MDVPMDIGLKGKRKERERKEKGKRATMNFRFTKFGEYFFSS